MFWLSLLLLLTMSASAESNPQKAPADVTPGSITYDEIAYPHAVSYIPLVVYGQDVRMAYMDVAPVGVPNGRVIVLLHGMNFGGFYFARPIEALRNAGFRVIVPDQIGFGRSSKPIIPYNFHDMARNTRNLLQKVGVTRAVIFGHSMGGMLTARFASSYPDMVERAVICNAIGMTDIRWSGTWNTADDAYKTTMAQSNDQNWAGFYATIRRYFPGVPWTPEYEKFVRILYAPSLSADWPRLAMVRAIYRQMPFLDPVIHDWEHIKARTLVIGGEKDYDDYPEHARRAAKLIPNAEMVLIPGAGHVPHIQAPESFERELLKFVQ